MAPRASHGPLCQARTRQVTRPTRARCAGCTRSLPCSLRCARARRRRRPSCAASPRRSWGWARRTWASRQTWWPAAPTRHACGPTLSATATHPAPSARPSRRRQTRRCARMGGTPTVPRLAAGIAAPTRTQRGTTHMPSASTRAPAATHPMRATAGGHSLKTMGRATSCARNSWFRTSAQWHRLPSTRRLRLLRRPPRNRCMTTPWRCRCWLTGSRS
mmetsp:Transcript_127550/g.360930  ORF Transcript_127550/g.360930 Transcript_127550/m.360930 type:complete len:217 (+) Transcript_127550:140-790(+)